MSSIWRPMQVSRRLSYTQEAEDALWRFLIPVIAQGGPQLVDEATRSVRRIWRCG